ncbi:MAG: hypothetical protein AAGJ87_04115 [Pseudomonadota bacterium]
MPYGVKQGYKTPGQFGITDMMGLALAGSAGIVAALVTDYQSKGEASAIYTINQWTVSLASLLGLGDIPLYVVILGLIGVGAGSIFYFQPITRQGAFAQGFGLLAVIMTAVPADLAGGLEAIRDSELLELEPASSVEASAPYGGGIVPASFTPGEARVFAAQSRRAAKYDVYLKITFEDGLPGDIDTLIRRGLIRGRLHNEDTGQTYNLFRTAGGGIKMDGDKLIVRAGVPARSEEARLWVRIECASHKIEQQSAIAKLGQRLDWDITVYNSSTPLWMQRLGQSYWF